MNSSHSFHRNSGRFQHLSALVLLCFISPASAQNSERPAAWRISAVKGPYFLCDRRVVEDHWLIERFVVPPIRHADNPLIVRDHAWEGTGPHAGGSVIRDPDSGRFLMWYSVWSKHAWENKLPFSYNVCLAESNDGVKWRKPSLGVFDFEGSRNNNCIRLGTDKTQNVDVCINPRPDLYPGRFLSVHNQKGGVFVSWSDDGRTFTRLFDQPAISYHSDTHNNFVFDEVRNQWLLYCRPRAWAGYHRRRVALQSSDNLRDWTHERTILVPTETEIPEYYGMTVFRRGDLFFGIVQIFDHESGLFHGELAWSGDGIHWDFLPTHPPFITLGSRGEWDAGMATAFDAPVEVQNELRFYYGGFRLDHNQMTEENLGSIGLMTAERDRIAGVRPCSDEAGFVMTRPFVVAGRQLLVNATVSGRITAEVRTDGNKTLEGWSFDDCNPVVESGFAQELTWQGRSLEGLQGRDVRILFRLDHACLFAFELPE